MCLTHSQSVGDIAAGEPGECAPTPQPSDASSPRGVVEALLKALPPSERELFERFAPGRPPTPMESGGRALTAAQHAAQQQAAAARVQLQTMLQQALCARARPAPASRAWHLNMRFPNGTLLVLSLLHVALANCHAVAVCAYQGRLLLPG